MCIYIYIYVYICTRTPHIILMIMTWFHDVCYTRIWCTVMTHVRYMSYGRWGRSGQGSMSVFHAQIQDLLVLRPSKTNRSPAPEPSEAVIESRWLPRVA